MTDRGDTHITDEELARYINEVRTIRRTLVEAEGSFRIFHWFYHLFGGIVLAGVALNWILVRTSSLGMHDAFIFIWLPMTFLVGVLEMFAWIRKSTREQVPLLSPPFVKYVIAFSGYFGGLVVLSLVFIRPDMPVPGIVLILTGMMFCVPVQYTHTWFALEAIFLMLVGVVFVVLHVVGTSYFVAAGVLVAAVLFVAGIIESMLLRRNHG
ncbi:MAG TPA: hypothetical protein VMW87_01465 [Spirochaetia bacterium]|nr:hypothetical protein [Spirochaetia bacterium]